MCDLIAFGGQEEARNEKPYLTSGRAASRGRGARGGLAARTLGKRLPHPGSRCYSGAPCLRQGFPRRGETASLTSKAQSAAATSRAAFHPAPGRCTTLSAGLWGGSGAGAPRAAFLPAAGRRTTLFPGDWARSAAAAAPRAAFLQAAGRRKTLFAGVWAQSGAAAPGAALLPALGWSEMIVNFAPKKPLKLEL